MTPDWPRILKTLLTRYRNKELARVVDLSPQTIGHLVSGRRKGARMAWAQSMRLLALYDVVACGDEMGRHSEQAMEWALERLARMREMPPTSKVRRRREAQA